MLIWSPSDIATPPGNLPSLSPRGWWRGRSPWIKQYKKAQSKQPWKWSLHSLVVARLGTALLPVEVEPMAGTQPMAAACFLY